MNGLLKCSAIVLTALVVALAISAVAIPIPLEGVYSLQGLAYISGLLALYLIVISGAMMLFKKDLLGLTRYPEGLRLVHVVVSAVGGVFLVVHVALSLALPVTLTVLLGYLGTGTALVIWMTGMAILAERHGTSFYHALLSIVGVALIVAHAYGADIYRNFQVSAVALGLFAFVLVVLVQPSLRLYFRKYGIRRLARAKTSLRALSD